MFRNSNIGRQLDCFQNFPPSSAISYLKSSEWCISYIWKCSWWAKSRSCHIMLLFLIFCFKRTMLQVEVLQVLSVSKELACTRYIFWSACDNDRTVNEGQKKHWKMCRNGWKMFVALLLKEIANGCVQGGSDSASKVNACFSATSKPILMIFATNKSQCPAILLCRTDFR